jgi:hypothetical protein
MKTKLLAVGSRTASRHPGKALRVSLLAIRYRRAILLVTRSARRATELGSTVSRVAADPKVRTEAGSSVSSLVLAGKRARRVGVAKAPSDKQVAAHLRRAGRHASRAMTTARHPRRRILRTTTIVTGAGALSGAAYVGWRAYGRPLHPVETPWEVTGESMAAAYPGDLQTPDDIPTSTSPATETDGDSAGESPASDPPGETPPK